MIKRIQNSFWSSKKIKMNVDYFDSDFYLTYVVACMIKTTAQLDGK